MEAHSVLRIHQHARHFIAFVVIVLLSASQVSVSGTSLNNGNATADVEIPRITVNDSSGRPCLLGTVNLTVEITYHVGQTDESRRRLPLTDDVAFGGDCGLTDNMTSLLSITWPNGTLQLNMTFQFQNTFIGNDNTTATGQWYLNSIAIYARKSLFISGAVGVDTWVSLNNASRFKTPMGLSFFCDVPISLTLGGARQGAVVTFNVVHLQPFLVKDGAFSEAYVCKEKHADEKPESYVVPIAVACCLAAIVIGVVIGYAITRRIDKFKDQSDYKPM